MRKTSIYLAGIAVVAITGWSAMAADQDVAGVVTGINRLNSTIAIQRVQSGTVGANTGDTGEEFKVKDVNMMESVHAGDRVTFSTSGDGAGKTITKLDRK